MHPVPSLSKGRLALATVVALALAAGGCATTSGGKSSSEGAGAQTARVESGAKDGDTAKGKKLSWWQRMSKGHREPKEKPWVYGDVRPGKGLLGDDEHGFTLYRQGEGPGSSDGPSKPQKVKR